MEKIPFGALIIMNNIEDKLYKTIEKQQKQLDQLQKQVQEIAFQMEHVQVLRHQEKMKTYFLWTFLQSYFFKKEDLPLLEKKFIVDFEDYLHWLEENQKYLKIDPKMIEVLKIRRFKNTNQRIDYLIHCLEKKKCISVKDIQDLTYLNYRTCSHDLQRIYQRNPDKYEWKTIVVETLHKNHASQSQRIKVLQIKGGI